MKSGGTGFQPVSSFKISRRNLPHLQEPDSVYFLTWRSAKGVILSPEARTIALEAIRHWDAEKWTVYAAVIMPDHVHTLSQPLMKDLSGSFDLSEILHSVKSYSSHRINQLEKTKGSIWQDERYDRIIRDEKEFVEKLRYIRTNPLTKGLCERPEDYPWLFEKDR